MIRKKTKKIHKFWQVPTNWNDPFKAQEDKYSTYNNKTIILMEVGTFLNKIWTNEDKMIATTKDYLVQERPRIA